MTQPTESGLSALRCKTAIKEFEQQLTQFAEQKAFGHVLVKIQFENGEVKLGAAEVSTKRTR
jgi:hypothetical protein